MHFIARAILHCNKRHPTLGPTEYLEEATRFETGLETDAMTYKLSFLAAGLFAAATALTMAASAQEPSVQIKAFNPASAVEADAPVNPGKVYCYNGAKRDQANLYRGWTCILERRAL
jgi:hypothetical protein